MKTFILAMSLFFGAFICTSVSASCGNMNMVSVQAPDGYSEVKLESLNAEIQEAVKGFEASYTVKTLAYNKDKKQAKVTLVSKSDQSEKTVFLDEKGKEVKE